MTTDQFPLDFQSLAKGDVIQQERIESIYRVSATDGIDRFRFAQMTLSQAIETERHDLLCRIDGLTVRVMTDAEAEDVTWRRVEQAVGSIARNAKRRAVIVRDSFTGEDTKIAESRDRHATFLMVATRKQLRSARRERMLLLSSGPEGPEE